MLPIKYLMALLLVGVLLSSSCRDSTNIPSRYNYVTPTYNNVQLVVSTDSITFPLDSNTFPAIKSFNYFLQDDTAYISFYDKQSQSISIYNFYTSKLVKKVLLQNTFRKKSFYKTSVFCKNLDTLFVGNNTFMYQLNGTGQIVDSIEYQIDPYLALASIDNLTPCIVQGNILYAEARPRLKYHKKRDRKKWRVLYQFDLSKRKANIVYSLPEIYEQNMYDYEYIGPGYCYNNNARFVFSFPADTNIYETDLKGYHYAYYGKSQFQEGNIQATNYDGIITTEQILKRILFNDAYGGIFFDAFHKRYLRIAKRKLNQVDYRSKNWNKEQSLIIFDADFKIIGESKIDRDISLSFLFITSKGEIYARNRFEDDKALHFVRLEYKDTASTIPLANRSYKGNH